MAAPFFEFLGHLQRELFVQLAHGDRYRAAEEEKAHALRFVHYVLDTGGELQIPVIAAPQATFATAEAASQYLITEQSICTVPWDDAGAYLRLSTTYEAADEPAEDSLMAEAERRLTKSQLVF